MRRRIEGVSTMPINPLRAGLFLVRVPESTISLAVGNNPYALFASTCLSPKNWPAV